MAALRRYHPEPLEQDEQIALFRWAAYAAGQYPQLANMYHVPNGGKRTRFEAGLFKAMGVKPGVPDIVLDWPAGGFHGLRIELKRAHGGRIETAQGEWRKRLIEAGYCAVVCRGWDAARQVIEDYLCGKLIRDDTGNTD